jgi:hypothetical protein
MVSEGFDTAHKLNLVGMLSPEQKQTARETVCGTLSDVGCTTAEIEEIMAILGILPHEEECPCGDC